MKAHITPDRWRGLQNANPWFWFSAWEVHSVVKKTWCQCEGAHKLRRLRLTIDELVLKAKWVSMVWTRELIHVGRTYSSYIQVTLERSDFRTDFRTRQKNKAFSLNHIPRRTLRHQTKIAYMIALQSNPGATATFPVVDKHERGTRHFVYVQVWCPLMTYILLH